MRAAPVDSTDPRSKTQAFAGPNLAESSAFHSPDATHAVAEATEAGVAMYYVGVGPVTVDPLPEVFGPQRSQRIRRVEDLPRVLAHVHRELISA